MVGRRGLVVVMSLQLVVLLLSSLPCAKGDAVMRLPRLSPPVHPPPLVPRRPPHSPSPPRILAVEGVIYCRCKLQRYSPSMDASPLNGAVVSLKCGNDQPLIGKTDANGYFLLTKQPVSGDEAAYCTLHVVSSPIRTCAVPGPEGVAFPFKFERIVAHGSTVEVLYTTGVIMFGPNKSSMCPANP